MFSFSTHDKIFNSPDIVEEMHANNFLAWITNSLSKQLFGKDSSWKKILSFL